jgi:ribonuclease J
MVRNVELARNLGYLRLDEKMTVQVEDIGKYPENQLVVMTTGSQGEPFSGLVMMSRGEHKQITLGERDAVFLLASVIPGNEKLVNSTINRLFSVGCEVVYESDTLTHVSGHASSEELKIMLNLTRPQYFVPIHGEYRHLAHHSQLAQDVGIPGKNVFVMTNGEVLTFSKTGRPPTKDRVQAGAVVIDGNAVGELKSRVIKERRDLAEDGIIVVSLAITREGELLAPISVDSRGFLVQDEKHDVLDEIRAASESALKEYTKKHKLGKLNKLDTEALGKSIKSRIYEVARRRNASYAVVMPLISVAGDEHDSGNWMEREFY